jgi:hypothetical protein
MRAQISSPSSNKRRRLRLMIDAAGRVRRSTIDFGNRPLPVRLHRRADFYCGNTQRRAS